MAKRCDARSQKISLEDDGIIRVEMQPGVFDLELSDAQEVMRAIGSLCGGVRRPVLVDLRGLRSMSRECRKYFAGPQTAEIESAVGLLVGSPVARAVGNFFMGLNKPLLPTRLFTAEPEALTWLRGFVT